MKIFLQGHTTAITVKVQRADSEDLYSLAPPSRDGRRTGLLLFNNGGFIVAKRGASDPCWTFVIGPSEAERIIRLASRTLATEEVTQLEVDNFSWIAVVQDTEHVDLACYQTIVNCLKIHLK